MRKLNLRVLRRQPAVQERQRLQQEVVQQEVVQQEAVQLEQALLGQQELVLVQPQLVLRELLQVQYRVSLVLLRARVSLALSVPLWSPPRLLTR